jgi:hypothetical protein
MAGPRIRITEMVQRYAPREYKVNHYSRRNHYSMACPLPGHDGDRQHPDGSGSFSVDETDNLFRCFGCGRAGNAYQLYRILSGADSTRPATRPAPPPRNRPAAAPAAFQGVTIGQLSQARGLEPEFLRRELRWQDVRYCNAPAIKIPYFDEDMANPVIRFRVGLDREPRFRWQKFNKGQELRPYGLWTLPFIRRAGTCYLVEGETDFAVLSYHGFPVMGIPGATSYQAAWTRYFQGLDLLVWREPGRGGEVFVEKISLHFSKIRVVRSEYKDPCEVAQSLGAGP